MAMTYRRVRPGTGYRARLRNAVMAAADGDTIVVPGIRDAVDAYCANRRHRDADLAWRYESPWRVYSVLPEWAAALRHAVLDTSGPDVLMESVGTALLPLVGHGLRLADGWFYEQDGIQVVVPSSPTTASDLAGLLRDDCAGAILVQSRQDPQLESPLFHADGCPVAVVEYDSPMV